jgi:uncharacterized phiE125 gp8 family phage protein
MWLQLMTPPTAPPVTLAEAKAHLRVLTTAEDDLISALVLAATHYLEGRTGVLGRALMTQTWQVRFDGFPGVFRGRIELPMPPLQSVDWVQYIDTTGVLQTLDPSRYVVDRQHLIGRIRPVFNTTWPPTLPDEGTLRIQFTAGYGDDASAVPSGIKQSILLLVGHWWSNRAAVGFVGTAVEMAVEALTAPYRMFAS